MISDPPSTPPGVPASRSGAPEVRRRPVLLFASAAGFLALFAAATLVTALVRAG